MASFLTGAGAGAGAGAGGAGALASALISGLGLPSLARYSSLFTQKEHERTHNEIQTTRLGQIVRGSAEASMSLRALGA